MRLTSDSAAFCMVLVLDMDGIDRRERIYFSQSVLSFLREILAEFLASLIMKGNGGST